MNERVCSILDSLESRYPELCPCRASIEMAFSAMRERFRAEGQLFVCGNGGSAADAEHIVGELMKGFLRSRPLAESERGDFERALDEAHSKASAAGLALSPEAARLPVLLQGALPALALGGGRAISSAFSNDVSADAELAQELHGLGRRGDMLLAISSSGNSRNVVLAAIAARAAGILSVCLVGEGGGILGAICDIAIRVPERETYKIQELHIPVYHALCAMLEEEFFGL